MTVWLPTLHIVKPVAAHSIGSTMAVGGSALSGLEAGGAVAGIFAGMTAVIGLAVTIYSMNKSNRRAYERELREAEKIGEDRYHEDMTFWRGIAVGLLQGANRPIPVPPSEQSSYFPRPVPIPTPDEEGELA